MSTLIRGPAKPKQSNRDPKATNHRIVQAMFRLCMHVSSSDGFAMLWLVDFNVDDDASDRRYQDAEANSEEGETRL